MVSNKNRLLKEEMGDWVRDNEWMVFRWVMEAEKSYIKKFQIFSVQKIVELQYDNDSMGRGHGFLVKTLMRNLFFAIVFGKKTEHPYSFDGYYTKFEKFPEVNDIQLYYRPMSYDKTEGNVSLYKAQITSFFCWGLKDLENK